MDRHYTRMIWAVDNRLLTIPDTTGEKEASPQEAVGNLAGRTLACDAKVLRFARQLNRCIARYHAIVKRRQTRKENRLPVGIL